jgi:DNA-binding CsgD family transcriptional regulator
MASRRGPEKKTSRSRIISGNGPDRDAVPIGLEVWRVQDQDAEYMLVRFPTGAGDCWNPLTPRERSVASEALRGLSNLQIAERLGVAPRTVANQLASIFRKLEIGSRAELASLFAQSIGRAPRGLAPPTRKAR